MNVYNLKKEDIFKRIVDTEEVNYCKVEDNKTIHLPFHNVYRNIPYEDTYSVTPYATFMITPLSQMDGEDIVSRFDRCHGEWVNKRDGECQDEPCKKIKQHFIINNPDYTGEHCRDKEGRRLRDDDMRHVFCNHDQNINDRCGGKGKCEKGDVKCKCNGNSNGPNCENA